MSETLTGGRIIALPEGEALVLSEGVSGVLTLTLPAWVILHRQLPTGDWIARLNGMLTFVHLESERAAEYATEYFLPDYQARMGEVTPGHFELGLI